MNESSLNASVGLKLRTLRLQRHVKQADAARDLGVSPAYLNLIEKGKRVMPFPLLWKALRYFDQDPEQFMGSLGQGPVDETLAKLLDEPLFKSLDIDPEDSSTSPPSRSWRGRWPRCSTSTRTPGASWRR